MEDPQEYYQRSGPMTALGAHAAEFSTLPGNIASLCEVIQGVLIHRDIAPFLYGVTLSEEDRDDAHIRPIAQMLTRIHALDARPLTIATLAGKVLTPGSADGTGTSAGFDSPEA